MFDQMISYLSKNQDFLLNSAFNLLIALVIFYIGRWLALGAARLVSKALLLRKVDRAVVSFLSSIVYAGALIAVALIALSHLGIQTTSFIAILGAAGLAIALALQGSLSNFASGVLIIIFRPFKAGDMVDVAGISGVVERIDIFQTIFKTGDNKKIIVPNSQITGGPIINYSAEPRRRIDLVIGISYDSDLRLAKQILHDILSNDPRILKDPAAVVAVSALADSAVQLVVRPWVQAADYWPVYWDILEKVKLDFDHQGIEIPFPQMSLHMKKEVKE
ncbi:mechanosensitive ion channel domain-containing protein [Rheinheimera sp. 4Y26]|uniref:mechanosensitive ion channel domain-containing protein n=1 Tax=Rheinheimera sp. 4Y26 TaxID=2977811 RepID=UPI0021B0A796|nr:mechanosensitive ion channel domain-containing protein [Rheinheimera sp. 4Y26]MCT6697991.1 mechanosensitive ion channel [Rheinheimera sp. 4Y26]